MKVKLLLLVPVLFLIGCKPADLGVRFTAEDTKQLCEAAGGKLDSSTIQIGVVKSVFWDSLTITSTCVRDK